MKTKRLLLILSLCYGLNLFGQIPSSIPQNGLVAYYPFDGNVNDVSGNGNDGTLNEYITSTVNRFNVSDKALSFNYTDPGVPFQNNNIGFGTEDLTISAWIYKQGLPIGTDYNYILLQTDDILVNTFNSTENYRITLGLRSIGGASYISATCSNSINNFLPLGNFSLGEYVWTNLTVVFKNFLLCPSCGFNISQGDVIFYVNGLKVNSPIPYIVNSDFVSVLPPIQTRFSIGSGFNGESPFYGSIDDIAIYNRALEPSEISAITVAGISGETNLTNTTNPVPPGIPYQAVARNMQGEPVSNSNVQVRFSIRDSNTQGPIVYSETHSLQTDTLGLFSTAIGSGTPSNNGNFNQINWSQTIKYLQVELDFGNGWTDFGTQQLMSVPYALYAGNSQPGPQGPAGPRGITGLTGLDGPQGEQGPIGLSGANGATGPQGEQGIAGTNGKNSLVKTSVEPSGATCPTGGVKMEHGLDTNNDGVLDESEINATLTQYLCNGLVGPQGSSGGSGFNHYIGEQFGGGVIYHLWKDDSGVEHGLIVDITDLSNGQAWSNVSTTLIGSSAGSLYNGLSNSNAIVGQDGHIRSASALCLNSTNGGQNDWYLPSVQEFNMLWKNYFDVLKSFSQIPGATQMIIPFPYWSSTEREQRAEKAYYFSFFNGESNQANKDISNYNVRAIRSF